MATSCLSHIKWGCSTLLSHRSFLPQTSHLPLASLGNYKTIEDVLKPKKFTEVTQYQAVVNESDPPGTAIVEMVCFQDAHT